MFRCIEDCNEETFSEDQFLSSLMKPIKHLLLDTNILLQPHIQLHSYSDSLITCNAILSEIRDRESREQLSAGIQTLLGDIITDEPDNESIAIVRNAATITGDLASLAPADVLLASLAVKLMQQHCPKVLKPTPSIPQIDLSSKIKSRASKKKKESVDDDGWATVPSTLPKKSKKKRQPQPSSESIVIPEAVEPEDSSSSSDMDSEDGWIGPETEETPASSNQAKQLDVAVMTQDYALQNLLMHMNIPVVSTSARRINSVKVSCLVCSACRSPTREMEKVFCPKCGNDSLIRVGLVVGRDGIARLPKKFVFKPRLKGTKYPLPLPKAGRNAENVIVREDQLKMAMRKKKKNCKPAPLTDEMAFIAGGVNPAAFSSVPKVGLGINANASRKRSS
ncbi:hypothetical protein GEMRC1_006112 [Eukaryota sp. GEM-RC1]